jgi:hypothetical protein
MRMRSERRNDLPLPDADDTGPLSTADTYAGARDEFRDWGTIVRNLGLTQFFGVKLCDYRLPDAFGRPHWTYGIFLSLHEGVTRDEAISAAALTALGNVMERWRKE